MKPRPSPQTPATRRRKAEALLKARPASCQSPTEGDLRRVQHELLVHQIELEMQNEELRNARAELEASLERYTDLYEFSPLGYFTLTPDGVILQVNLTGAKLLGMPRANLVGKRFGILVAKANQPTFHDFLSKIFAQGKTQRSKLELTVKGRDSLYVRAEASPSPNGMDCRLVLIDITEGKHMESALQESEARYRSLFDNAPDGILIANPESIYLDANASMCRMLGYTRAELIGLHASKIVVATELKHIIPALKKIKRRLKHQREWQFRHKDGSIFQAEVTATMLPDGNILAMVRDLAERRKTENALRLRETALGEVSQGVLICDAQRLATYANNSFAEMTGYTEAEVLGRNCKFLQGAGTDPDTIIKIRKALNAHEPFEGEILNYHKDGQPFWNDLSITPFKDKKDGPVQFIGIQRDITERKRAEAALQKSELEQRDLAERLKTAQAIARVGSWETDLSTMEVIWSAETYRIFEVNKEEFHPTHEAFLNFVHPEDRAAVDEALVQSRNERSLQLIEHRILMPDGRIKVIDERWQVFCDESGQPTRAVGTCQDVTDRKKAQEALLLAAKRVELAARAGKVGIWDWDIALGTMHWDEQMYALYHRTVSSSASGVELWQQHLHPDDSAEIYAELQEALRPNGKPFDTTFRILLPGNGGIRHIRGQGIVFRDGKGNPSRMIGTNWDITEQVEREAILREKLENEKALRQQALAGELAKSEFLAVMSHEIRTPMNGILGFAEMLSQSPTLTPENRNLTQTIVSSGEALLRILNDILDISRIEAGRLPIHKEPFSPKDLIRDIETLFGHQIKEKGLKFQIQIDKKLPETLLSDVGRIRQVLVNLLGNALKFTEKGSVTLIVRTSTEPTHKKFLEFVVRDTGPGIAPNRGQDIFEAFTQADSSTSRRHGGTGLGLTISRRLAHLMGGDILLFTELGKGSRFILHLPLIPIEAHHLDVPAPIVEASPPSADFAASYPQSILIVEDDKINLMLMAGMLRKLGYSPLMAKNGLEAIAIYKKESPNCILMDVQMPEIDGLEATRLIRDYEQKRHLHPAYISALTANIQRDDQQRCFNAGMNTFLNKPIKFKTIADTLAEAWKSKKQQSPDCPRTTYETPA